MNAIELLKQQHQEALGLCDELKKSGPGPERKSKFKNLSAALLAHMAIEEELFYPALARTGSDGEMLVEAYEEHVVARGELDRCAQGMRSDEIFQVRIGVLKELLEHHIKEENEDIFPKAQKALGDEELESLGVQMQTRFEKVKGQANPTTRLDRLSTSRESQALAG